MYLYNAMQVSLEPLQIRILILIHIHTRPTRFNFEKKERTRTKMPAELKLPPLQGDYDKINEADLIIYMSMNEDTMSKIRKDFCRKCTYMCPSPERA